MNAEQQGSSLAEELSVPRIYEWPRAISRGPVSCTKDVFTDPAVALDQVKETVASLRFIRETLFPRWDRHRAWRVVICQSWQIRRSEWENVMGVCVTRTKHIYLDRRVFDRDEVECTLVHEICHAVAPTSGDGHGAAFLRRMQKAAADIERAGCFELAGQIALDRRHHDPRHAAWVADLLRLGLDKVTVAELDGWITAFGETDDFSVPDLDSPLVDRARRSASKAVTGDAA